MNALLGNTAFTGRPDWLEVQHHRLLGLLADKGASPEIDNRPNAATEALVHAFGLSVFERDVLMLCATIELDDTVATAWSEATGQMGSAWVTPGLLLHMLPGGQWTAFGPQQPLLRWHLLEESEAASRAGGHLRVADRVLQFLLGNNQPDPLVQPLLRHIPATAALPPSQDRAVEDCVRLLAESSGPAVLLQWVGDDELGQHDAAALLAKRFGLVLHAIDAPDLPTDASAASALARLWEREAGLLPAALLINAHRGDASTCGLRMLENLRGLVMLAGPTPLTLRRVYQCQRFDKPGPREQRALWSTALADAERPAGDEHELDLLATQFRFSAGSIQAIAGNWKARLAAGQAPTLRRLCQDQRRLAMDDLAERIEPMVSATDLVVAPAQARVLRQIAAHARHRMQVHHRWGFAEKGSRGLGTAALFCGESGTGKTMACEVLAGELDLDLYRIDLSGVVSKYIGETEKNLARVFDAADGGGVLLLFDEADALFGKRSEVKDSHDRHANVEIAYLLQRIESYAGVAILTSNMRSALDPAFLRRLRFIVTFQFPDATQRELIWRRAFPPATPLDGLDYAALARLRMAGGQIRNIALNSAFLAADEGRAVTMAHLLEATRTEAAKQDRPLSEGDTRGFK